VDSLNDHVRQVELLSLQSEEMARALAQEQERFQILAEQSPLGLAFLDAGGRFVYTNPAFGQMFGYARDQTPDSRDWMRRAYPDEPYRRQVVAAWRADLAAYGEGQVRERTFRVTCADGSAKDVLFRSVGLAGGEQLVVMEDVTRRLAAEREFKRSEARLRTVVEGSPDAIFLLDEQGKVLIANRMAARLFSAGLPPQGKRWLDLLPPERLSWGRDLLEWVDRGKVALEEVELPVAEGAGLVVFELMAINLDPGLTFLSLRNISHRRRLDEQRQEAARLAGVVELAGTAAHELNQPLTSRLASSEMMLLYSDPADLKRQARRIRADALTLAKLVERFGRIVRYETKEYLPGKHIIDLERAVISSAEHDSGKQEPGKPAESLDGRAGNG
jgi:PAS domain S-box-containing protein